jgi:uroporphyrinogen decarboxylase
MTRRERFFAALHHQKTDTPPYFFSLCAHLQRKAREKYGDVDYRDTYDIPIREVFLSSTRLDLEKRFADWTQALPSGCEINEWGVGMLRGKTTHFFKMLGPLAGRFTMENIEALPFPDFLEDYRWEGLQARVEALKQRDFVTMSGIYGDSEIGADTAANTPAFIDIFESSWYLCGLDEMLMAMYSEPELAEALLERMTVFKEEIARRWARAGVDVLVYGDDVGAQTNMMMSGSLWRKLLKPRLRRVIDAAKRENPDVVIFYHSDGDIRQIIPDLIEVGVEILNPIQPECMDPEEIARLYGEKLSFWGTVGTQTTFPFGGADDVRRVCQRMVETVGKRGGLILAPTHLLEPDVPFENVEAFFESVRAR